MWAEISGDRRLAILRRLRLRQRLPWLYGKMLDGYLQFEPSGSAMRNHFGCLPNCCPGTEQPS